MSARRTRPPTLLTMARRIVREHDLFSSGELVVVACSGGPDSTALLHVLALLRPRLGHRLMAVGVDHGLRRDAEAELEVARGVARDLDVPFETARVEVPAGANLQARARQARLGALTRVVIRCGGSTIATGHTADDRAETVLIRLLHGSGPRGLAVLPPRARAASGDGGSVHLVRPLLRARRSDVMAHLGRHRLPFCHDPSNRDTRFLRARVRHELLPMLEELSPGVVGHLCALADMLALMAADVDPLGGLNRAQRLAVERVMQRRQGRIRVRVSGDRELEIGFRVVGPGARARS